MDTINNIRVADLPRPQSDPDYTTAAGRIGRLKSQLSAVVEEFREINAKVAAAERDEVDALASDKEPKRARALVLELREKRSEVKRRLLTMTEAIERLEAERRSILNAARARVLPTWTAARPVFVQRVAEAKAAYNAAKADLIKLEKAEAEAFRGEARGTSVLVRVLRPCLNLTPGEVAGLPPEKARDLASQKFVRYEEEYRQIALDLEHAD